MFSPDDYADVLLTLHQSGDSIITYKAFKFHKSFYYCCVSTSNVTKKFMIILMILIILIG